MQLKNSQAANIKSTGVFFLLFSILIGLGITILPHNIPILTILSVSIFLFAFAYTELALIPLIFAMLLSPEIGLGAVSKGRSVVIRIEDLLIFIFFLSWLARSALQRRKGFIVKTPINKFISLYILVFFISTVKGILAGNVRPLSGFFYILKYFEYFLLFYLVLGVLKSKQQLKNYLTAFYVTFAIVNVYAFTQIGSGRVSAPFEGEFGEPNTLGGYQILILALLISHLMHVPKIKWRWSLIGLSFFSLIPFAYTLSRSSYLSIIPMYFTLIIFNKTKKRNFLISILIVVVILSIFFFPQNVKERIKYTFVPYEQDNLKIETVLGIPLGPSASARIMSWRIVYSRWRTKPFLGFGVTGTGFMDSQFIRTLAELGLIGLVAFILLLITVFRNTLRIYKNAKDPLFKGLALGFLAGHVGMIFHATTANTFILIRIMEPYWFLAAMVMIIPKLEESMPKTEEIKVVTEVNRDNLRNTNFLLNGNS